MNSQRFPDKAVQHVLPVTWRNMPTWARETFTQSRRSYENGLRKPSLRRGLLSIAPRLHRPIFVIGAARSGTTFLGSCLAATPGVSYHHEPVATKAAARYLFDGSWSDRRGAFYYRSVYRWLLRIHADGDLRFAEKTPRNCFIIPFLAKTFPDARFIHIIRDGRDAALSLSEKPWLSDREQQPDRFEPGGYQMGPYARFWVEPDRTNEFESTSDYHRCIWAWRRYTEAALAGSASIDPARVLEIRYEEFVADPDAVGTQILDFLGIQRQTDRKSFLNRAMKAKPDSVGRWRDHLSAIDVVTAEREAGQLLRRLSYAPLDTALTG